jgi:hypothetical protein
MEEKSAKVQAPGGLTRTGKQASGQHIHFPLIIFETEFSETSKGF